MSTKRHEDITGKIGTFDGQSEVPMYSFDRVAHLFWQGVYNELRERGWTQKQAFEFLQSKHPRWMLDGTTGEELEHMGAVFCRFYLAANRLKTGEV